MFLPNYGVFLNEIPYWNYYQTQIVTIKFQNM